MILEHDLNLGVSDTGLVLCVLWCFMILQLAVTFQKHCQVALKKAQQLREAQKAQTFGIPSGEQSLSKLFSRLKKKKKHSSSESWFPKCSLYRYIV